MEYTVTVATGTSEYSGTNNYVYVTLIGERGTSERTMLDNPGLDFCRGAVDDYTVKTDIDLGRLILVRLEKQNYFVEDNWFCCYVKVRKIQEKSCHMFPCYRWLVGDGALVELREGTAKKLSEDILLLELAHRKAELQERQKKYRWFAWAPGIPKCIEAKSEADLPQDARFENEKRSDFEGSLHYALLELSLKKLVIKFGKSWSDLEDFRRIFWKLRSPVAEYTMEHWKEDWFFCYQFLNGSNPLLIRKCKKIPSNFQVTGDMVQSSLMPNTSLDEEIKKGNIFLVDHAVLDGIPANVIQNSQQYIAAPLCLMYDHPENGLIPIAIQLEQKPDKETPVFLPSDHSLAWLLAKMWVRHAEFQVFQVLSHLLRTHLVVEVFCVATMRQLPAVHPIYKVVSTGGDGLLILAQREYKSLTYSSLQPKLDFVDREVTKLRDYFYRDHSLLLWDVIQNFVSEMITLYYTSDSEVEKDYELQAWIHDVVFQGFVDLPKFGLASELKTREELITLLSVVIFISTAQHAATNNGQFDWCAWVPNTPCTMRRPPPNNKDDITMGLIMDTLPDISQSCVQMAITWHLGRAQPDAIPLGQYVEQYFTEPAALKVIGQFRKDLKELDDTILSQNKGLELQYLYLCPSNVENSITI
ncbi:hypothetical protein DNTS_014123 [Danionella cerebrum]|uniref:Lipoxygenase domain-containing protein n=1 Tax=Danionella cerebrum TaxID=2873325 RepID=A0A553QMD2_9TELE|nr:hypothetical protein DNTS_014123 [Danionella translucida]